MSYASIIVAVDPGKRAASRITMAAHLARRFDARLIGVAAWGPDYPRGYGETSVPAGYGVEDIRQKALAELVHAERAFRDVAKPAERIEWRSQLREPVGFLVEQSRAADLVVVGRRGENDRPHLVGAVGPGDALMATGRPVLVVPPGVEEMSAARVVVAWKNTSQGRRAISDAMPLLRRADMVKVVQVSDDVDRTELDDVVAYLGLHGIDATGAIKVENVAGTANAILKAAQTFEADLIVSGAFGYSRLREWFFGGVTRELLDHSPVCCLMSH
ncbi:universal stress protein [Methylobacterium sp. SD274]|uniref:universal stress protein n=1 Tax=unclassified Methylobacterium TaxID=2615210 RepID=UPI001A979205|nr:universal stress protein [Methylobacterium sp. SD274]MBO1021904.1 universal stress protein [Methylobacterium sp. SD274]